MRNSKSILPTIESEKYEFKTSFNEDVVISLVAFSNTKGGVVYIGISDNGEIKGIHLGKETTAEWVNEIKNKTAPQIIPDIEVITIDDKTLVSLSIIEYPVKPVSTRGRYYKRVGNSNHLLSVTEVVNMHLRIINSSWDFYLRNDKSVNDISLEKVQKLIDTVNRRKKDTVLDDPLTFLRKYQLITDEKISNACWLLFMPDMDIITTVELGYFSSPTSIKDSLTIHSDLFAETDEIMDFILKHINKQVIIKAQLENVEHWDYPLEALRELVLNMVIHRDYTSSYDSVLKIFDTHIEFYNPGALPVDIDLPHLLSNDYISQPRNKLVAEIFKASGLIEKYGSGIKRVLEAFAAYDLLQPEFIMLQNGFMVKVFSANYLANMDKVGDKVGDNLTVNQNQILQNIIADQYITANELAAIVKISKRKIEENISKLKQKGIIQRIGSAKGGYWQIINE